MTAELALRVHRDVVAPLVLGGPLRPGRPLGGAAALTLGDYAAAVDVDLRSRVDLARTRVARRLSAIDLLPDASKDDWTLFGALHDWLAAASPELASVLSPRAGDRVLDLVEGALERTAGPRDALAALSRHTFFARLFEITRTDVRVSFWAGSREFLGTKPPARLLVWKDVRRVRVAEDARPLMSLPDHGARVDGDRWVAVGRRILALSPLTDLATLTRSAPAFVWSPETLGLVETHAGLVLALRAARPSESGRDVLAVLGREAERMIAARAYRSLRAATAFGREMVLSLARESTPGEWSRLAADAEHSSHIFAALALGALATLGGDPLALADADAELVRARLSPIARSDAARALLGT